MEPPNLLLLGWICPLIFISKHLNYDLGLVCGFFFFWKEILLPRLNFFLSSKFLCLACQNSLLFHAWKSISCNWNIYTNGLISCFSIWNSNFSGYYLLEKIQTSLSWEVRSSDLLCSETSRVMSTLKYWS